MPTSVPLPPRQVRVFAMPSLVARGQLVLLLAAFLAFSVVAGNAAHAEPDESQIAQQRIEAISDFMQGHFERAFTLFLGCAEAGDIGGERGVAFLYANGLGVAKDMAQAEKWYRRAADRHDARAQNALGVIYASGMAGQPDFVRAAYWYGRAAAQGSARAQYSLGQLYDTGRGVARDYGEAARWYMAAASQGLAEAQYEVGHAFSYGTGVPQDDVPAYMWFALAALNAKRLSTQAAAEEAMRRLRTRMAPPDIAAALARADAWKRPPRSADESDVLTGPRF